MEFGAATTTLPKKLLSDYNVAGKSTYDGVFAAPLKLRPPSLTARFKDYREIFDAGGVGGGSLGSSIPILQFLELNKERNKIDEVRRRGEKKKTEEATTRVGMGEDEEEEEEEETMVGERRERRRRDGGGMMAMAVGRDKGVRIRIFAYAPMDSLTLCAS
ncbi:hypothetical protein PIB30_048042 [Stylosanthes scabra]|uniref:Uncharacterized protein n=1 Tax=Stylosanthes scabra TaxID=79078 RepID=A0ABU6QHG1_9FABA|nr:hypothetical protein [Stylosanthes scabra]